jgi:hypothetical protein
VRVRSFVDAEARIQVARAVSLLSSSTVQAGELVSQSPVQRLNT